MKYLRCTNCDIPITWTATPVMKGGKPFCCDGCVHGGPCTCTYAEDHGAQPASAPVYCIAPLRLKPELKEGK